jgi:hypothetical protein
MNWITKKCLGYRSNLSRESGLTTIETIMLVLIAAGFIFAIAYFVNEELVIGMFEQVRKVLGFEPKTS